MNEELYTEHTPPYGGGVRGEAACITWKLINYAEMGLPEPNYNNIQVRPLYVSDCGHVASYNRKTNMWNVIVPHVSFGSNGRKSKKGKRKCALLRYNANGKVYAFYIHRAVAATYHPGHDPACTEVDHLDGNRFNNRADNLEWVTTEENRRRRYANIGRVLPLYDRVKFRATLPNVDSYFYKLH